MNPLLTAVTFDLDGLLINSEDVYLDLGNEILARRGKAYDEGLRAAMLGRPARDALREMIDWHQLPDSIEALGAECDETFWQLAHDRLRPMPGVLELLELLDKRCLPRGVATSGSREYAERALTEIRIRDRFNFVLTADDVTYGKPAPEVYMLAAKRHGVKPVNMLVLEDSPNGCKAGLAAGAYTVAVPSPHTLGDSFPAVAFAADTLRDPLLLALLAE
jgi:pseudouridine 5'-phosphatase